MFTNTRNKWTGHRFTQLFVNIGYNEIAMKTLHFLNEVKVLIGIVHIQDLVKINNVNSERSFQ